MDINEQLSFSLDDALFTFLLTSAPPRRKFTNCNQIFSGQMFLSYTSKTDVSIAHFGQREVVIIGFCVDAHGEFSREQLAGWLISGPEDEDVSAVFRKSDRFAGQYAVLYQSGGEAYAWGDATCTIELNYAFQDGGICIGSIDNFVAEQYALRVSELSARIRRGSFIGHPMPNDMTMFDEVKALLPNHYLDIGQKKAVRVPLGVREDVSADVTRICERSVQLISQITAQYAKAYSIVCPLSSGYDSRCIYAFLSAAIEDLQCYTFKYPGFTEQTGDYWVPKQICAGQGCRHTVIEQMQAPEEYVRAIADIVGENCDPLAIHLAWTHNSEFRGKAVVKGDIIDQVGKSLLGNAVPYRLASPSYLTCKVHNHAPETKGQIKAWMDGVRASGEQEIIFDLFALESRCGRWAAQGDMLYALCGVASLNIFNCRELIKAWVQLPRKMRTHKVIHEYVFETIGKELTAYPFNPGSKMDGLKKNWFVFYILTFVKQYLMK